MSFKTSDIFMIHKFGNIQLLSFLGLFLFIQIYFFSLISCGLSDSVPSLPDPPVNYLIQTGPSLFFVYQPPNTVVNFQGYEIFYKVYTTATGNFTRLLADRDNIYLSPTVSNLQANGYTQFTMSKVEFDPIFSPSNPPNSRTPAVIFGMNSGDVVRVDFSDFLNQNSGYQPYSNGSEIHEPLITLTDKSGNTYSKVNYLYRSSRVLSPYCSFWNLSANSNNIDIFDSGSTTTGVQFEINIFIVAYGVTNTLQPVTSRPVPWGLIGPVLFTTSTEH